MAAHPLSLPPRPAVDGDLAQRAHAALAVALARYGQDIGPTVRSDLAAWSRRAHRIDDPRLRALALGKLAGEGFNAEVGAIFATRAPRAARVGVARGIVALELLFDLLDGVGEDSGACGGVRDTVAVFAGALDAPGDGIDPDGDDPDADGTTGAGAALASADPYVRELAGVARAVFAQLPAHAAVAPCARRVAAQAAGAQERIHSPAGGLAGARAWARPRARGTGLGWRELLVGSAAWVLALHALLAAAADARTTAADAAALASAYLPLCATVTLLDAAVDRERDRASGTTGYLAAYDSPEQACAAAAAMAALALARLRRLPSAAHHHAMLAGAVAYYATDPRAAEGFAGAMVGAVGRELEPLLDPALSVMGAWRARRTGAEADDAA